jgi:hypothetical protein
MKRAPFNKRRRPPSREAKRIFYVFCEGGNTEPKYFAALQRATKNALVEIKTYKGAGVPKTLAGKAIALRKSLRGARRKNSFEGRDEVWAIFDRDDHEGYYEAIALCNDAKVGVANSNPCFEVWLVLHNQDYHKPDGREDVYKLLKKLCPEYDTDSKTLDFDNLMPKIREAEKLAQKQLARRIEEGGNPLGPPYTLVFKLTTSIREASDSST